MYSEWIRTNSKDAHRHFAEVSGQTRAAVRNAKTSWIKDQAAIAESGKFSGKQVCCAIRSIQRCYSGLCPVSVKAVRDEDGELCTSLESQKQRWQQHVTRVPNVRSTFNLDALLSISEQEVNPFLADTPSEEDLLCALGRLRNDKAGGTSRTVPELLKVGRSVLLPSVLDLVRSAWSTSSVPQDWRDAQLVPIPKKGDLSSCDNRQGIALQQRLVVNNLANN